MIQNPLPHDHGQTIEQELEHRPSVENFQTVADIFKQLGDGSRIRIFWLLCHMRSSFSMSLLYHAYVYLEFLILACTIYILAPGIVLSGP